MGARPGVTRGKQWVRGAGLQLLDSPGILWPKFEDQEAARKLAITAAIRDEVFDQVEMAQWLLDFLQEYYRPNVIERYGEPGEEEHFLETIGRKRGFLRSGGLVDVEQAVPLCSLTSAQAGWEESPSTARGELGEAN